MDEGLNKNKLDRFQFLMEDGLVVSTIESVSTAIPADEELFGRENRLDTGFLREHFTTEGKLSEEQVLRIIAKGTALLRLERNLIETDTPIVSNAFKSALWLTLLVCGDIHGQYYDLLKLFDVSGGEPPTNKYLFLGDYVDRGYFSVECYLYLLALKINYPDKILLLRGNHECRHLTKHFTFRLECMYKYSEAVYEAFMDSFDALPLCALVSKKIFCVHGGISPLLKKPQDVNSIYRFQEPPKSGLMCDLLWSDPAKDFGQEGCDVLYFSNSARGCSSQYSYLAVCQFLTQNNLLTIVRGHEAQDAGYRFYRDSENCEFPALITMFSAPNYVDVYNNKGAVLKYDGEVVNIRQFKSSPHPYYLPKFMNVFDWSLPFVGEKIAGLLMSVLNIPKLSDKLATLTDEERGQMQREKRAKMDVIRSKIRAVGRINRMLAAVREERETLTELTNAVGTNIAPAEYLTLGDEDLRDAIHTFSEAKKCDKINEMLPPPPEEEGEDAASIVSLALTETPKTEDASKDIMSRSGTPPPAAAASSPAEDRITAGI